MSVTRALARIGNWEQELSEIDRIAEMLCERPMNPARLLSAFQVLTMQNGFFGGVTHKQARSVILEMTGIAPKGKPDIAPRGGDALTHYITWLIGAVTPTTEEIEMTTTTKTKTAKKPAADKKTTRKSKMKFADLPADRPGKGEDQERFMERMAAVGNREALELYQAAKAAGVEVFRDYLEGKDVTEAIAEVAKKDAERKQKPAKSSRQAAGRAVDKRAKAEEAAKAETPKATVKKCKTCEVLMEATSENFRPQHNTSDGLHPHCRECSGKRMKSASKPKAASKKAPKGTKAAPKEQLPVRATKHKSATPGLIRRLTEEMEAVGVKSVSVDLEAGVFSMVLSALEGSL